MSTPFSSGRLHLRAHRSAAVQGHQFNSWSRLLERWRRWDERSRRRAALRNIADDTHLLADLGITRDEALDQADQPIWR